MYLNQKKKVAHAKRHPGIPAFTISHDQTHANKPILVR